MFTDKDRIQIVEFSDQLKQSIKTLNYEWLERYFRVEEGDIIALSNPRGMIIDKGGFIFYAQLRGEIIGTASLLKKTPDVFELGKMAVSNKAQGHGAGKLLLEHCLNFAKQKRITKLVLYSNTQLVQAIHLYRKYGFKEIELEHGLYERANIKMEKYL
ncbi:MAG: GNAT family N-acetyltransferase [Bacteroidota bacterium]